MILIQRQVLSSSAASVSFTSIPQNYKTLKIYTSLRDSNTNSGPNANASVSFNGLSPSGTFRELFGTGTTAGSGNGSPTRIAYFVSSGTGSTANTFGNGEMVVPNYAGSSNKVFSADSVSESNVVGTFMALNANLWSNTAAITSITFTAINGSFVANSSFSLYGLL